MAKDHAIESLRGIAIILVVGLHITNDGSIAAAQGTYDYLAYTFQNIRIPLFTVISGYLYGLRPVARGWYQGFIKGKCRRILVPLFVVITLQFSAKSFLPGVNEPVSIGDIWAAYIYPYEHFWFLQAIFVIFVVVGFLDYFCYIKSIVGWLFFLFVSIIWFLVYPKLGLDIPWFSIGTTSYIFPYFLLGYGIARHSDYILRNQLVKFWLVIFLILLFWQQALWFFDNASFASKRSLFGLMVSIFGCLVLFHFRRPVLGLSSIGSYAFTIYLYQGFGTSIGRRIADYCPDFGPHFYFFLVLGVALLFGVLVEVVFSRVPMLKTLMLGLKGR